ncbi:unnamed protein product [Ambrosiozyma monospora]|uniref:Unnamed protein product n=1 Tax=Ambrosiozyma monospora TaxID=43982 RepID=A0ACB5SRT3_AMBMO|nr:unnamed protein product [Ambrosiozyma monospora]
MSQPKNSAEEDDVLDFLNSLPDDKNTAQGKSHSSEKPDDDILDFLDELEATEKKEKTSKPKETVESNTKSAQSSTEHKETSQSAPEQVTTPSENKPKATTANDSTNVPVNDPITQISSWWSREGSAKVSSGITSLWGTAQSLSEQAQKQAEGAIKKAREQSLEENLRNTFKEIGISGVLEGDRELTDEEKSQLLKLPDTKKALESLNKGFGLVSSQLTNVLEKIQQDMVSGDELLDITLVHDLKNYKMLPKYVKKNFESVMQSQVDGDIFVTISESGILSKKSDEAAQDKNLGLFSGKISDGEKLIQANIDSVIKENAKTQLTILPLLTDPNHSLLNGVTG